MACLYQQRTGLTAFSLLGRRCRKAHYRTLRWGKLDAACDGRANHAGPDYSFIFSFGGCHGERFCAASRPRLKTCTSQCHRPNTAANACFSPAARIPYRNCQGSIPMAHHMLSAYQRHASKYCNIVITLLSRRNSPGGRSNVGGRSRTEAYRRPAKDQVPAAKIPQP